MSSRATRTTSSTPRRATPSNCSPARPPEPRHRSRRRAMATQLHPGHVPEALVYDFDISHDPLQSDDLYLGLGELARRTPEIFYTPRYGGHWVVRSHEA